MDQEMDIFICNIYKLEIITTYVYILSALMEVYKESNSWSP